MEAGGFASSGIGPRPTLADLPRRSPILRRGNTTISQAGRASPLGLRGAPATLHPRPAFRHEASVRLSFVLHHPFAPTFEFSAAMLVQAKDDDTTTPELNRDGNLDALVGVLGEIDGRRSTGDATVLECGP